jgi:hypothetical protein
MRSGDRGARALAAELLAETENGRLRFETFAKLAAGCTTSPFPPMENFDFRNNLVGRHPR